MTEPPTKPQPQSPNEETRKGIAPLLPIIIILGIFFLIVLVISILLLPDKGKKLLKLSDSHPVTLTTTQS